MSTLERILLIEDDPDLHRIAQLALEKIGHYCFHWCCSGQEALDHGAEFSPDLILLDVMMPGMDGFETLSEMRKMDELANIPVVFMTAKVQNQEIQEYLDAGAIDVIAKPFDPMQLAAQVQEIWDAHH